MATQPDSSSLRRWYLLAVGVATGLAVWLRVHGITLQVVLDDEWHALHKLQSASYSEIFNTFGLADHSIPLTLFYKWMANTFGLAEGRLRVLQVISGVILVPVCAWAAWGATRDRAVAVLLAFLVAGAPFLVMWSRFARPYSISLVLAVACMAFVWRWRHGRSRRIAAAAAMTAMLSSWFHPLMGVYPALGCTYIFLNDVLARRDRPGAWRGSLSFGFVVAVSMAVPLTSPFINDREALSAKSGGDHPDFATYEQMFSLYWGGLPTAAYLTAGMATVWGLVVLWRRDRALAGYAMILAIVPAICLTITGAVWIFGGGNFGRYQLPLQPLVLFLGSAGGIDAVRRLLRMNESAVFAFALVLAVAYLALTPAIRQVAQLGTWYSHGDYHWDYRVRWLEYKRADPKLDPPGFYRELAKLPRGSITIVEAPYVWEAPYNPLAYYATYHHQQEVFGMLYDVCKSGDNLGEVPRNDRRFRFRRFVPLGNPENVKATGARYIVFNRDIPTRFSPQRGDCVEKLSARYGTPVRLDSRVAVWDLRQ